MKKIILLISLVCSGAVFSKPITNHLTAHTLKYNEEKKLYDVQFTTEAGIYKADEKFLKCLQKSIESKKAANVSYEPMGLKITDCSI